MPLALDIHNMGDSMDQIKAIANVSSNLKGYISPNVWLQKYAFIFARAYAD